MAYFSISTTFAEKMLGQFLETCQSTAKRVDSAFSTLITGVSSFVEILKRP